MVPRAIWKFFNDAKLHSSCVLVNFGVIEKLIRMLVLPNCTRNHITYTNSTVVQYFHKRNCSRGVKAKVLDEIREAPKFRVFKRKYDVDFQICFPQKLDKALQKLSKR